MFISRRLELTANSEFKVYLGWNGSAPQPIGVIVGHGDVRHVDFQKIH